MSPSSIGPAADRRAWVEMTKDDLDEDDLAELWVPPTAAEILSQPLSKPTYLLPGLVVEASNTEITVAKGVSCSNVFAQILGYSLAGGIQFSPFGKSVPVPTLVAYGLTNWYLVKERLSLIANQIENQDDRAQAVSNLRVSRPRKRSLNDAELNYARENRLFRNSIPKGCKVVIFPNGAACIGPMSREDYHHPFSRLLSDLNGMGIATVTFYHQQK
jgi:hypothetical protein